MNALGAMKAEGTPILRRDDVTRHSRIRAITTATFQIGHSFFPASGHCRAVLISSRYRIDYHPANPSERNMQGLFHGESSCNSRLFAACAGTEDLGPLGIRDTARDKVGTKSMTERLIRFRSPPRWVNDASGLLLRPRPGGLSISR
jgi:hypothetical protein